VFMHMRILDCETVETTYNSLEAILGLSRENLTSLFDSVEPHAFADQHPEGYRAQWRGLLSLLQAETDCQTDFDATCWFHCTRTWEHAFDEGLLPHSLVQEKIWDFLFQLVKDRLTSEQWAVVRKKVPVISRLYAGRLQQGSADDGPHGLLVRESAIAVVESGWGVNYFDMPELVDNICRGFRQLHDIDLEREFRTYTRPAIVKFRDDGHLPEALQVAIFYVYCKRHDLCVTESCNRCYSGHGHVVDRCRIEKVDFL
jgi:hypothetical protein